MDHRPGSDEELGFSLNFMFNYVFFFFVAYYMFLCVSRKQNNPLCLVGSPTDRQCLSCGPVSHKGLHAAGYRVSSIH